VRKLLATIFLIFMICVLVFAQVTTTPNLQLQLPSRGTANYDVILNSNFQLIDSAIGILQNAYQGVWSNTATYSKGQEVNYLGTVYVSLTNSNFNNTPSTSTATWASLFTSSGTVTTVGDLANLFTVANRTTAPAFSLVNQSANVVFSGPASGASATPTWRSLVAADIPGFLNSNTSGNAATATALASTPTLCSTGNYSRGVDALGNAQGCTATSGGTSPTTFSAVANRFLTSYNSGTTLFTAVQPAFTDISGTATSSQLPAATVYNNQANTYTAGMKQSFGSSATTAGVAFGGVAANPSSLSNGDLWYRSDTNHLMARSNGTSQQFAFISDTFMNWSSGPYAGNIPATAGVIVAHTTLPAAITVVSFTMNVVTASAGCTTLPQYQLYDITSSTALNTITLVNGTAYYANTGLSIAVTSGHEIGIRVGVSSGGCTTPPSNGMWTAWYTM
jgi:hypothetical protein